MIIHNMDVIQAMSAPLNMYNQYTYTILSDTTTSELCAYNPALVYKIVQQ